MIDVVQHQQIRGSAMPTRHWLLKKNCALTPRQLALWFLSASTVSLSIAIVFAWQGAWMVLPFACLEVTALGLAYVFYGLHAADFEKIEAGDGRLVVVRSEGSKLSREEHVTSWVRIEYEGRPRSLIWLVVAGKKIAVGRFMPEHKRAQLVKELRQALVMI